MIIPSEAKKSPFLEGLDIVKVNGLRFCFNGIKVFS